MDGNILRYKIDDAIVTRIVPGTYGFILQVLNSALHDVLDHMIIV